MRSVCSRLEVVRVYERKESVQRSAGVHMGAQRKQQNYSKLLSQLRTGALLAHQRHRSTVISTKFA